jgi:hypothetical protein
VAYYNADGTHLALDKDSPATRSALPPGRGQVIALPTVGGLKRLRSTSSWLDVWLLSVRDASEQ